MPPRAFTPLSPERMGRIGPAWSKKENPRQIIIHGEEIFLSGLLYRSLSQHVTLSISSDKCQSKGLSPGFLGKCWRISETIANESTVAVA